MPKKRECSHHVGINYTRYCVHCDEAVNEKVKVVPNCEVYHKEKKGWGANYCPDCGIKL